MRVPAILSTLRAASGGEVLFFANFAETQRDCPG
jgi:hypothetical protein